MIVRDDIGINAPGAPRRDARRRPHGTFPRKEPVMRRLALLLAVATAAVALVPDPGEACWRRRRACAEPCAVYYYPPVVYAPYYAPPYAPRNAAPARGVTIKGRAHYLYDTGEAGEFDQEPIKRVGAAVLKNANIPDTDAFHGTARKIAKTTIFAGEPKTIDSVAALHAWMTPKADMLALMIPKGPDSDRVKQEQFNVTVPAFIYAFRKEDDNDYHVIIGDAPGTPNPRYMNSEVSGIPVEGTEANRAKLWDVRKAFKGAFQLGDEGPKTYFRPQPPVPVRITGSIFWDVDHEKQVVGPSDFKPKDAWEVHPISAIEFLD
jgi:hypothetical protein